VRGKKEPNEQTIDIEQHNDESHLLYIHITE